MLNCKQACVLLSEEQDRKLTLSERSLLLLHLAFCPHCRRYKKQLAFIRKNISDWQKGVGKK
ncbi:MULTISPECIES: zf-HC2 domain-containing protein [unclassified Neisseria]|uniref:zf-HC2 domain-containing protein n=1 Tax=unclassified Neisseria TaxID=2623750 RepID=UPI0026663DB9|nr:MULTISPECIES: zf-HC2 domain-containing protein [unclassified Neisseria]MDO1510763.1 zf-HC2 domain-containing protein [Neisseria sp. MVDL19-042950]MDO1517052.1 zf-HC2 domain-containing protein [Neisseria sp. MVDL18-041461]MDO1564415.1 zf-HC2 domain-containing protein [Neisseria sp. MVDL20-010259]